MKGKGSRLNEGWGLFPMGYPLTAGDQQLSLSVEVAAVPEPGTWAMMVGGFGVLTLITRRRRAVAGV